MRETSSPLSLILYPIKAVFFYHKKKLLFFIFSILFFLFFLFPFSDLTLFSKDKINQQLKGFGSSVDYSKLNLNLNPFGIKTSNFVITSPMLKKPLSIGQVTLRPNILALLKFQPGGTFILEQILGGNITGSGSLTGKTSEKTNKFNLTLFPKGLSLLEIAKFQGLNFPVEGLVNGELSIDGEDSFRNQPQGSALLNLTNVTIPSAIPTPFGTFDLPEKIVWSNSNILAEIKNGQINIKESTLGTKQAPINGRLKGYVNCLVNRLGAQLAFRFSCNSYDIKFEIELNSNFHSYIAQTLGSFLNPQSVNIIPTPSGGAKYLFSVQGNLANKFSSPKIFNLSSF